MSSREENHKMHFNKLIVLKIGFLNITILGFITLVI